MKMKTLLAAAILALSPTLTLAMGCQGDHATQEAMSCAEGTMFDDTTGKCEPVVTG